MSETFCDVKTTSLASRQFKNMKSISCHKSEVYDCASVIFPDGKTKIITCSHDKTIRIFDLESEKCENIINHSSPIFSVHFYKEENVLMTTDENGELLLWDLFSTFQNKNKIVKRIEVSEPSSFLWKLTQISSNLFFCCVRSGRSKGFLYSIKFKNINEIKIKEIDYPLLINNKREELRCIYKLKTEKNTIILSGGDESNGDRSIKKYNFKTKKHFRFRNEHFITVLCLTSFISFNKNKKKNEEIILSGSKDKKIIAWTLNGKKLKEIHFKGQICCFLNDFRRKNIFIITGGFLLDSSLYSLNYLKRKKIVKNIEEINNHFTYCVDWVDENKFISCADNTLNIFELEKIQNKYENEDMRERIRFIREEDFVEKYFCSESNNSKKMPFSVIFCNNVRIKNIFKVLLVE